MAREKIKVTIESGTSRSEYQGDLVHVMAINDEGHGVAADGISLGSGVDPFCIMVLMTEALLETAHGLAVKTGSDEKELLAGIGKILVDRMEQLESMKEKKPEPKVTIISGDKAKRVLEDILRAMEDGE